MPTELTRKGFQSTAAEEQRLAVEASKVEEERKMHEEAVWKVEEERRAEAERKSEEERLSREEMLRKVEEERRVRKERDQQEQAARKVEEERRVRKERDQQEQAAREVEDAQRAVEERVQHAQAEQLRKGDKQMEIAHELAEKQQVEDAKRVVQVAVGFYRSAGMSCSLSTCIKHSGVQFDALRNTLRHTQNMNTTLCSAS